MSPVAIAPTVAGGIPPEPAVVVTIDVTIVVLTVVNALVTVVYTSYEPPRVTDTSEREKP